MGLKSRFFVFLLASTFSLSIAQAQQLRSSVPQEVVDFFKNCTTTIIGIKNVNNERQFYININGDPDRNSLGSLLAQVRTQKDPIVSERSYNNLRCFPSKQDAEEAGYESCEVAVPSSSGLIHEHGTRAFISTVLRSHGVSCFKSVAEARCADAKFKLPGDALEEEDELKCPSNESNEYQELGSPNEQASGAVR